VPTECAHGQLARSCEICDRDAVIAEMVEALSVTAGNIRSLGPAGDIGPYAVYQPWLKVVEDAIARAAPNCGEPLTTDELIAQQAMRIAVLEARNQSLISSADAIKDILFCVGGPLNDNVLGYSKPQLATFFRIADLVE